jgi:uncharacterized DUF497 family protein
MDFEWDDGKAEANLAKHGVDFIDAIGVFLDSRRVEGPDVRRDYGEARFYAIGTVENVVMHVTYTWRGKIRRIISARRASRAERATYGSD